jgi:hypothetical protein
MDILLLILAAILLIWGVAALINGAVLFGLILVVVGVFLAGGSRGRF